MKLRLGDTLIETDHIEYVYKMGDCDVMIRFRSGEKLQVVCNGSERSYTRWAGNPESLLKAIEGPEVITVQMDG